MSGVAVRVEGLSKWYRLGQQAPYRDLRAMVAERTRASVRGLTSFVRRRPVDRADQPTPSSESIWALRDVSFDVGHGEVLGIIGRNGAGKSTLLKVLSRITAPTLGHVEIHGRVGSLLEVGTGFHPELTGRENVFLNGALLGMRKAEIARKFDEIVAFAEVERFLDTPVKRYSSGMHMRLAFAVAAHLEPEILVVDEVLAVGDAGFQKKCLGRMSDVARAGRTVLFVSHNLAAVESLCDRVIWLENGMVRADGHPGQVIAGYLQTAFSPTTEQSWPDVATAPGNEVVRLRRACVRPVGTSPADPITVRTPFVFEFDYWKARPNIDLALGFHLYNEQGVEVFSTWNNLTSRHDVGAPAAPAFAQPPTPVGLYRNTCDVPGDLLNDGLHRVELWVASRDLEAVYWQDTVLVFEVRDSSDRRGGWFGKWTGTVRPALNWTIDLLAAGDWSDTLVASRQDGYNNVDRCPTGSASLPAVVVSSEPPPRPGVASSLPRMEG